MTSPSELKLYLIDVGSRDIREDGLFLFTTVGTPRTIDGEPFVKTSYGSIVPARRFHPTLAAAQLAAADEIEELAQRLANQAARLREEAQHAAPSA